MEKLSDSQEYFARIFFLFQPGLNCQVIVCSLSNMSAVVDLLAGSCYGTAVYTSVVSVSTGCQSIVTATK